MKAKWTKYIKKEKKSFHFISLINNFTSVST